jgi:hypothetical protein
MYSKKILAFVSVAGVLHSGAAFSADSWQNATWGAVGNVANISTESSAGNSRLNVDFKADRIYKGSAGNCIGQAGGTVLFSITNNGYSNTGTVQQQKQDMWKNIILLAKSTGSKVSADVGPNCELWDLRLH